MLLNLPASTSMIKGKDGLYYISSSLIDKIRVMKLQPDIPLKEIDVIHLGMPVDNLSLDKSSGEIYAGCRLSKDEHNAKNLWKALRARLPGPQFGVFVSQRRDTRLQKYWRTRRQRLLGGRQLLRMIQRLEDYS